LDFTLTEEQTRLREAARDFATGELADLAKRLEADDEPVPREVVLRMGEHGYLGVNVAPEYGGLGLGNLEALLILEEFAKVSPAVAFPVFEASVGPIRVIERFAEETLKQRLGPKVCRGRMMISIAMSEPDAGSALTDLKTRAIRGKTTVKVSGHKRWCSGGGHADGYLVYCRLSNAPGAKGIGAVYVDAATPGLSFGPREPLMGFRGIPSADIYLDDVTVPDDNVVVAAGGFKSLMEAFDLERCGNATMCLGIAQSAFDRALAYVQERRQFGRPVVEFQAVQLKLADMAMRVEAARLLIYRAIANAAHGFPSVLDSSIAKCFANEMVREVAADAAQVMGGYGYHRAFGMEQRLRDGFGWGIAGGAIDIQKTNIAAALAGRRFPQRRDG
jgi:butyryl-CoA dehydrogenase